MPGVLALNSHHHQALAPSGPVEHHPDPMMRRVMPSQLVVMAGGEAGAALGHPRRSAIDLAERVYGCRLGNI